VWVFLLTNWRERVTSPVGEEIPYLRVKSPLAHLYRRPVSDFELSVLVLAPAIVAMNFWVSCMLFYYKELREFAQACALILAPATTALCHRGQFPKPS
jgi:hypothetical protein